MLNLDVTYIHATQMTLLHVLFYALTFPIHWQKTLLHNWFQTHFIVKLCLTTCYKLWKLQKSLFLETTKIVRNTNIANWHLLMVTITSFIVGYQSICPKSIITRIMEWLWDLIGIHLSDKELMMFHNFFQCFLYLSSLLSDTIICLKKLTNFLCLWMINLLTMIQSLNLQK